MLEFKNILFIRSDRLGEFLLSLPAIKLVKDNHPQGRVSLLAQRENIELVKGIDCIDNFFEYDNRYNGFKGALKLSGLLKREGIDCCVVLNPKKEFHLAACLAGIRLRVGYDRKWGFCLNEKIKDEKSSAAKHEAWYNIDLVKPICKKVSMPRVELPADDNMSLDFLRDTIDTANKYIVIHPFTSNPAKKITDEFWTALISQLGARFKDGIIVIGMPDEGKDAARLAEKSAVKNLTGRLSLRNLAALLKYNTSLYIGLDSGPMHLASLMDIPVIGLFTVSNPVRWAPLSSKALVVQGNSASDFTAKIDQILSFASQYV